jgi:epoxyqueuosine reductase
MPQESRNLAAMDANTLTAALKQESLRLGFDLAGATTAAPAVSLPYLQQWLDDGCAGQMYYLGDHLHAYRDPNQILDGVRSVLMLAMNYRTVEPAASEPGYGQVSRYAWGDDYHDVIHSRLHTLADFHRRLVPTAQVRGVVDTAPLLERDFAQRAGLGWIGKNTMLIHRQCGSWLFLAALLTSEELAYDTPVTADGCGACRACLDACPTGALVAPHRLDARKCVSYLTIESRDPIPVEYRAVCGDRLFGCDACQDACPWNHGTPTTAEPAFQPKPGMNPVNLSEFSNMDEAEFRRRFRHTPLWRAKHTGILRNAAVVAKNGHE